MSAPQTYEVQACVDEDGCRSWQIFPERRSSLCELSSVVELSDNLTLKGFLLFDRQNFRFPNLGVFDLWLDRRMNEMAKSLPFWFQYSITQWLLIRPQLYLISVTLAWHTSSVFSREIAFFDKTYSRWDKSSLLAGQAFHPGADCRKPGEMGTHRDACMLFLSLQAWLRMPVRSQHTWHSCPPLSNPFVRPPFVPPQSICHCPAPKSLLTLSHTRWCLQKEPAAQMDFRLEDTEVYDTSGRRTDRPYVAQPVFLWEDILKGPTNHFPLAMFFL